jgi:hypothetical protein
MAFSPCRQKSLDSKSVIVRFSPPLKYRRPFWGIALPAILIRNSGNPTHCPLDRCALQYPTMNRPSSSHVHEVCSVESGRHFVQIYEKDDLLIDCLFAFLVKGFESGEVAIVIATRGHRHALEQKFVAAGYDVADLKRAGKYAPFDAAETLGLFMRDGRPEKFRFDALVGGLIKSAARKSNGVRAFGEMVAILWDEGNRDGAIELERLWNELANNHSFTLFCAYRENQFATEDDRAAFPAVCNAHSTVIGRALA